MTVGKVEVQTIAYSLASDKGSPVSREKFDISRKDWRIVGIDDERVNDIIDGDINTAWYQNQNIPVDVIIDLGKEENITGFKYLPDQSHNNGIVSKYKLLVSQDGDYWMLVNEGEFSNIQNNPLWQVKSFEPVKTRYIKFRAVKNTQNNQAAGYAELDIITN